MILIKKNDLENNTIYRRTIIAGCIGGVMAIFAENPIPLILGLVFGIVISILNFRLLEVTIIKSSNMTPAKAQGYVTSRYFIRLVLIAGVIYASVTNPSLNVIGTIVGLLLLKLVIIFSNMLNTSLK